MLAQHTENTGSEGDAAPHHDVSLWKPLLIVLLVMTGTTALGMIAQLFLWKS